ncbi:histidine phosphatase family protein [Lentibacillus salicampi]|uniref:Histidine phosphatase family protein n=1 Tax=Lentibacillus salicampi TaxID=175306 RepID=A0A4Y9A834_9BACI|nr:histidine phosphatase family protein [Lentibacillus salicampi]TFJ91382.1 histidine phosphatase family protein [Lentibacillus salicampi]
MEKKIYVVRHCEAGGQSREAMLTDKGANQADDLAAFFNDIKIDRIVSSPFVRAIQSAKPISEKKNMIIEEDERLTERILSTKMLPDWLKKLEASFTDTGLAFEGGESSSEATNRAVSVVNDIIKSEQESTMIVTHGNLMALLLKHFQNDFGFEQWLSLTNPDIYQLSFESGKIRTERLWREFR